MVSALLLALLALPLQSAVDIIDQSAGSSSGGQTGSGQAPAGQVDGQAVATGQAVLATLNGTAITATDLVHYVRQRAGPGAEVGPDQVPVLRRQLAEQILLAGQAELAGVELSDGDVERYWEDYVGQVPDFEAIAATTGSTIKRQREMAKRAVLAEIFVYHKIGLWSDHAQVLRPDPLLQKLVDVTPGQMRELYLEQPDLFKQPAKVAYEYWATQDPGEAESIRQVLLDGGRPLDRYPGQEEAPVEELPRLFAFSDDLVRFMQHAPEDTVSRVFEADFDTGPDGAPRKGYVIFLLAGRSQARDPDFADIQEELRQVLISSRVQEARRQLVAKLAPEAFYWPSDLFRDPTAQAGAGARLGP